MQSVALGTTDPVYSVCVCLSPIMVVSGPVRKGWGVARALGGLRDARPATKGIVIIVIITNVEEMSVPTRHRILRDNEREAPAGTE